MPADALARATPLADRLERLAPAVLFERGHFLPADTAVTVTADDKAFTATVRIDTPGEQAYYRNGGIMPYVLRSLL